VLAPARVHVPARRHPGRGDLPRRCQCLALRLARRRGLGWLVAAFHALLYAGIVPEAIKPCGQGPSCSSVDMTIIGLPLPYLSLAAFTAIAVLLIPAIRRKSNV
jgi:hypothetical protein